MPQKPKAPEWLIENIAEASKNARKIYFLYVGFLAYCALTVVSTSDRQIILNETASLPILKLDVPLNGFFLLAPLIAILVFIYFQLYLHRLKTLIDDLRTNYGLTGKGRLYPWMINIAEDPDPGAVGALQRIIVGFTLWTSLTLVLILFALWYVKKHEPIWSYVVGSAPIIGSLVTFWFWLHYEPGKLQKSIWRKIFSLAGFSFVIAFELCLFFFLIPWAREGGKYEWIRPLICVNLSYQKLIAEPKIDYKGIYWGDFSGVHLEGANLENAVLKRTNLKKARLNNAFLAYANLQEADLGEAKVQGAILLKANLQKAILIEANLQGAILLKANLQKAILIEANLQGAILIEANLQEADLGEANLQGADLGEANLEKANLGRANLEKAKLWEAKLQGADLGEANLQGANLWGTKLQGANLFEANLQGTYLLKANLQEANLKEAELQGADLGEANLQGANLGRANLEKAILWVANLQKAILIEANLQGANLGGANLEKANLREAKLEKAYLGGANLEKASLWEANLQGANLGGANLEKADLREANLKGVRDLTVAQLSKVKTLYKAKLDPPLMEQIEKNYAHLLKRESLYLYK